MADGYAAIGDAAFMTMPLIGSGIAKVGRVRSAADARAVEHYPEYSLAHYSFPSLFLSSAIMMRIASMATRIARSVSCSCGLGRPTFSLS